MLATRAGARTTREHLDEQPGVEPRDDDGHRPREPAHPPRRDERPHLLRSLVNITSGNTANGSCRLRMTWLRISSCAGAALAVDRGDDDRRHDGDEPGDQPPQPRPQADVEEPFHHDLAGQRAGERRVLPRASSATANSVLASDVPSSGASSL